MYCFLFVSSFLPLDFVIINLEYTCMLVRQTFVVIFAQGLVLRST